MCKTAKTGDLIRFTEGENGLPCQCGKPAVYGVAWKIKKKPSYIVIPLCHECLIGVAKLMVESGMIPVDGVNA